MRTLLVARLLQRLNNLFPILIFVTMLAANSWSASKYHDFLLKDGHSFRGRIVAYDQHTGIVSIECADNKLIKTSPAVFDEADQVRILEWSMVRCLQSESLFKLSAKKMPFKEKRELPHGKKVTVRHLRYIISFENKSNISLRNMSAEYCIYYRQEYCEFMNKWFTGRGVKYGKAHIGLMKPKSAGKVKTTDIIINKAEDLRPFIPFCGQSRPVDIDGIWIRFTLPLSNDRKAVREYCIPDNLNKHCEWADESIPIFFNKR